jgi:hypothetical protein
VKAKTERLEATPRNLAADYAEASFVNSHRDVFGCECMEEEEAVECEDDAMAAASLYRVAPFGD